MKTRPRRKKPELVLRDGKPAAVILELGYYQEMLDAWGTWRTCGSSKPCGRSR